MDYDNTNRGVLFDEEEVKSDSHPIKTGKLNVEGKEYRIAAWEKTSKTGSTFLSLAISEPKEASRSGYEKFKASKPKPKQTDEDVGEALRKGLEADGVNLEDIPF